MERVHPSNKPVRRTPFSLFIRRPAQSAWPRRLFRQFAGWALILGVAGAWQPPASSQAASLVGYRDYFYGNTASPTISKPESKLWWNDGSWWGAMLEPASGNWHIYRLNWSTQVWQDTGTQIDGSTNSRADMLWDEGAQKLYAAVRYPSAAAQLYRFSYNPSNKTYVLDSGFPVEISDRAATSTIVIDKDSTGQLWITYPANGKIWVNRSLSGDATWGTPFVLPFPAANVVAGEDISSVIKFGGDRIGVFWGNQNDYTFYFALHRDSDPDTTWSLEVADDTPRVADNHLNVKSLITDTGGRVYAAIKTSINNQGAGAPLIELLVRSPNGAWAPYTFSTYGDDHTVPMVLLDEENQTIYMFAVHPGGSTGGGTVHMKTSPMSNIGFPSGLGTPFISSNTDNKIHNPTSTKQNLNGTTNLVVLASDNQTDYYLHNVIDLPGGSGPTPTATAGATPTRTPTATATSPAQPSPTPSPGGAIKDMTFESGSLTGADGGDRTSGTVVIESASPLKGAYSARVPNAGSSYVQEDFTGVDDLYVSFYVRLNAAPSSNLRIALISNSGTNVGNLLLLRSGRLRLRAGSTTVGTESDPLSVGTVYRVGIHQKRGTGGNAVLEAFLAAGDDAFGSPFAATGAGEWTSAPTRFRVGVTNSNAGDLAFDNVRLNSTGMPGPN